MVLYAVDNSRSERSAMSIILQACLQALLISALVRMGTGLAVSGSLIYALETIVRGTIIRYLDLNGNEHRGGSFSLPSGRCHLRWASPYQAKPSTSLMTPATNESVLPYDARPMSRNRAWAAGIRFVGYAESSG